MAAWDVRLFFYAIFFLLTIIPPANPLSFNYPSFKVDDDLMLLGDAVVIDSVIKVTDIELFQLHKIGRVTSIQQMHLWDQTSRNLTNFSTNFSFTTYSTTFELGDGLAFFLADPNLPIAKNIKVGGGFGLVDDDHALNSTRHSFVAVEFDTYQNSWGPSGPHVGLDFNPMKSNITQPWSYSNDFKSVYYCSIDYNSTTHKLSVSYTGYGHNKQMTQYLSYDVDLREYLPEWFINVSFSAARVRLVPNAGSDILQSWSFRSTLDLDSQIPPTTPTTTLYLIAAREINVGLLVGLGLGIGVAVGSIELVCFFLLNCRKTQGKEEVYDLNMDDEFQKGSGPNKFCHNELVIATNNFSEAEKLGYGGFGVVYKGFLKDLDFDSFALGLHMRYSGVQWV